MAENKMTVMAHDTVPMMSTGGPRSVATLTKKKTVKTTMRAYVTNMQYHSGPTNSWQGKKLDLGPQSSVDFPTFMQHPLRPSSKNSSPGG